MVGPVTFIAAWAVLGATAEGYDPTRHPISRLATLGARTRPAMTAALVVLGTGMVLYGLALRPDRAWLLPVVNGATAFAVAALPLGGGQDTAHGVAAALGYVTLAAIPVAVGRRSARSVIVGLIAAACLAATVVVARDGLYQRVGLTVAHLWVVVNALAARPAPRSSSTTPPGRAPAGRRR